MFGWKIKKIEVKKDGDIMHYWMISTSSKEHSNEKSSLDGGLKRQHPQQPNLNYLSVSSIDEYSNKVNELGGKLVLPKTEITGYGFFAVCIDRAWLSLMLIIICSSVIILKAIAK
ncbi:MAG: VOC family protein [Nitrososphaeraceae archaeon]